MRRSGLAETTTLPFGRVTGSCCLLALSLCIQSRPLTKHNKQYLFSVPVISLYIYCAACNVQKAHICPTHVLEPLYFIS